MPWLTWDERRGNAEGGDDAADETRLQHLDWWGNVAARVLNCRLGEEARGK